MKKGLGRGLNALMSSVAEEVKESVFELRVNEIEPSNQQPRKSFNQEKLKALAESIKLHGVVQPIIVRNEGSRYIIVAGERRWRAAKLAGIKTIPVIVKDITPREVMEIALIENLQREDLNPIEEAEAYKRLIDEYNLTQEEVSKAVGKSRTAIANSIRLLNLSDHIKEMLIEGTITSGHARCLVTIPDPDKQKELAQEILKKNLNVRQTEKLAANELKKKNKKKITRNKINVEVADLEEKLKALYGTKINLITGKNKGKIIFEYYSNEEFDRIISMLLNYGNI